METIEKTLRDEEIVRKIEDAGKKERISPLDPDFIALALPFAIIVDIFDITLELTSFLVVPKALGVAIDVFTFVIIGGWVYWRTGKIVKGKEKQKKILQETIVKKGATLKKQLAKGMKGPLKRTFARAGIAFLGEIAWFIGIIPFWTIAVISALKEK